MEMPKLLHILPFKVEKKLIHHIFRFRFIIYCMIYCLNENYHVYSNTWPAVNPCGANHCEWGLDV